MAGKPRNRLELRRQYEAAEPLDPMEDEAEEVLEVEEEDDEERRPKKKKAAPKAKAKTKTTKAAKAPVRMRIVWAVVNDAFKTIATFEYSQKAAALAKAEEMTAKGKGTHFVQKVKEPLPDNAPGLGASIPRTAVTPPPAPVSLPSTPVEDEEEFEDEEDYDIEPDLEDEDD
jgi:hypothetical protein